jgi:hypothetical protein
VFHPSTEQMTGQVTSISSDMWIAKTFGTSLVLLLSSGTALGLPYNAGSATTYSQTKRSGITYDLPLTHSPFGLLTNISFGTPAQTFSTFVDWTWVGFHTFTSKCLGQSNNAAQCFLPSQKYFHEDQSSTWKNLSAEFAPRVWNPNHFCKLPHVLSTIRIPLWS